MQNGQLLYLSGEDVIRLGGLYMALALEDVEETIKLVYLQDCIVPGKIAMGFGKSIAGDKPGRESNQEFCYYKPVGMGVLDLAIAARLYRKARQAGIGTPLAL